MQKSTSRKTDWQQKKRHVLKIEAEKAKAEAAARYKQMPKSQAEKDRLAAEETVELTQQKAKAEAAAKAQAEKDS